MLESHKSSVHHLHHLKTGHPSFPLLSSLHTEFYDRVGSTAGNHTALRF